MCTANSQKMLPDFLTNLDGTTVKPGKPKPLNRSAEVPLGEGMADAAKLGILTRRQQMDAITGMTE